MRVDQAGRDRPAAGVEPGEPARAGSRRPRARARPPARGPTAAIRPSQQATTGASGRIGPADVGGRQPADLALSLARPDAAGHRDDLGRADDQEARRRLVAPAALDDPERTAGHRPATATRGGRRRGRPRAAAPGPASARSRAGAGRPPRWPAGARSGPPPGRRPGRRRPGTRPAAPGRSAPTSASSTPSSAATSRTVSQTSHSGVTAKSSRFIETWARPQLLDPEAVRLDPGQAAAGLADPPGDPLGELDVGRGEVDVVGDEERAGADRDGAGRRVQARRAEVRLAPVLADLRLEALVLAAADVGELDPFRSERRVGVEEDRQVEARGDPLPEAAGERRRSRPSSWPPAARTG